MTDISNAVESGCESQEPNQPLILVHALPKSSFDNEIYVHAFPKGRLNSSFNDPEKEMERYHAGLQERKEIRRIKRKEWVDFWTGVSHAEIFARYDRDSFGHKIEKR